MVQIMSDYRFSEALVMLVIRSNAEMVAVKRLLVKGSSRHFLYVYKSFIE